MLKILFINAIEPERTIQCKYSPLGIGHLVSALRERFADLDIRIVSDDVGEAISHFQPDIVGISSVTQNYERAIKYAAIAKKSGAWVLCGGVHISMLPSTLTEDMDVGIIGEGERTICELVQLYLDHRAFNMPLSIVPGIVYHTDGEIFTTASRDPIVCLDTLPPSARDMFPQRLEDYIFTSRGCPYKCVFCSSTRFWPGVRFFSARYIASEVKWLFENGTRLVHIYDDIFPLNLKRIRDTTDQLRDMGVLGKVEFSCSVRANMVTHSMLVALKEMGVRSIGLGLESGSEYVLRYLKGNIHLKDNIRAIQMIKQFGFKVGGSFIIGAPDESLRDIELTYRFIKKHLLSFSIYPLTPFPGTPLWGYALSKGLVSNDMDWSRLDVKHGRRDSIILSTHLTRSQLDRQFARFNRMRLRKTVHRLGLVALRNPLKVPRYIWRRVVAKTIYEGPKLTGE